MDMRLKFDFQQQQEKLEVGLMGNGLPYLTFLNIKLKNLTSFFSTFFLFYFPNLTNPHFQLSN